MTTQQIIERFIVKELLVGSDRTTIGHDQSLINSGILDSLALLQLIEFLETQFGARVGDDELLPENFQTINAVTTLVENKVGQNGSS